MIQPAGTQSIHIKVKAVPGATRNEIVGTLGDRLKVRVAAPPEGGKANKAICTLIAKALIVKTNQVLVLTGKTSAQKTIEVEGISSKTATERLNLD
jgi:uncharacterized protein